MDFHRRLINRFNLDVSILVFSLVSTFHWPILLSLYNKDVFWEFLPRISINEDGRMITPGHVCSLVFLSLTYFFTLHWSIYIQFILDQETVCQVLTVRKPLNDRLTVEETT